MLLRGVMPEESDAELLLMTKDDCPSLDIVSEMLKRLMKGGPIQYVLGKAEFCGMELNVGSGVLIPRPETEELVEVVRKSQDNNAENILDICTGSGCIALALKKFFPNANVEGWDISDDALGIAIENATKLDLNVAFLKKDVLSICNDELESGKYDVIVSNPPYICQEERNGMEKNVLDFEPDLALFVPDDNPLMFYDKIATLATVMLRGGGLLAFEINRKYGEEIVGMMKEFGFKDVKLLKDQFCNDRIVMGIWKELRKK